MKWFQHDSNARNDIKLKRLYRKYGSEGRDLYWQVIERIAEKIDETHQGFTLEESSEDLSLELRVCDVEGAEWDSAKVDAILNHCVDLKLFDRCPSTGKIRCLKILSRLDNTIARCKWIKDLINTSRRFEASTKPLQSHFVLTTHTEEEIDRKIEQLEKTLGRKLKPREIRDIVDGTDKGSESKAV